MVTNFFFNGCVEGASSLAAFVGLGRVSNPGTGINESVEECQIFLAENVDGKWISQNRIDISVDNGANYHLSSTNLAEPIALRAEEDRSRHGILTVCRSLKSWGSIYVFLAREADGSLQLRIADCNFQNAGGLMQGGLVPIRRYVLHAKAEPELVMTEPNSYERNRGGRSYRIESRV